MKKTIIIALAFICCTSVSAQTSINLAGLKFEQYDKMESSTVLHFTSNTQAMYIMTGILPISGKSYRDECPCKCTVNGTSIKIVCPCSDKEVFPDPIEDSFVFDASSKTLKSSTYNYTSGSAPEPSLSGKDIVWKQK